MTRKYLIIILFPNILFAQDSLNLIDAIKISMWQNYDIQISAKNQNSMNEMLKLAFPCCTGYKELLLLWL